MTPTELLAACKARGASLATAAGRLRFAGPTPAVAELRPLLAACKDDLIRALLAGPCPRCGRPFQPRDVAARVCWWCHDRPCEGCGSPTGSAFLTSCITCDLTGRVTP